MLQTLQHFQSEILTIIQENVLRNITMVKCVEEFSTGITSVCFTKVDELG